MQQIFVAFLIIFMAWILTGPGLWDVSPSSNGKSDDASGGLGLVLALPVGIIALIGGLLYVIAKALGWLIKAVVELLPYLGKGVQRLVRWIVNAVGEILKAIGATVKAAFSLLKKTWRVVSKTIAGIWKTAGVGSKGLKTSGSLLYRLISLVAKAVQSSAKAIGKALRTLQKSVQQVIRTIARVPGLLWKSVAATLAAIGLTSRPVRKLVAAAAKTIKTILSQLTKVLAPIAKSFFKLMGTVVRSGFAALEKLLRLAKPLAKLAWKPIAGGLRAVFGLFRQSGTRLIRSVGTLTKTLFKTSLRLVRNGVSILGKLLRPLLQLKPIARLTEKLIYGLKRFAAASVRLIGAGLRLISKAIPAIRLLLQSAWLAVRFTARSIKGWLKRFPVLHTVWRSTKVLSIKLYQTVKKMTQTGWKTFSAFARTVPLLWTTLRLCGRVLQKAFRVSKQFGSVVVDTVRKISKGLSKNGQAVLRMVVIAQDNDQKNRQRQSRKSTATTNRDQQSSQSSGHESESRQKAGTSSRKNNSPADNTSQRRTEASPTNADSKSQRTADTAAVSNERWSASDGSANTHYSPATSKTKTDSGRLGVDSDTRDLSKKTVASAAESTVTSSLRSARGTLHQPRFRPQTFAEANPVFVQRINLLSEVREPVPSNHVHGDDIIARMRVIGWYIREKLEEQHWI